MQPVASFLSFCMLTALLCAGLPAWSANAQQPEDLVTRFIDAWNAHDAAAFGKLFATDADWVTASGLRLRGRDQIRDYLAEEHATWAKHTRMQPANVHLRRMQDSSATVFFEWEISDGKAESPRRRGNNVFIVTRSDSGWLIVAGQVARKPVP